MREFLIVATVALGSSTLRAQRIDTSQADWTGVEQALGRRGLPQPGGVMRFGFPRGDLHVSIGMGRVHAQWCDGNPHGRSRFGRG